MWPFKKKSDASQPGVISSDGLVARYIAHLGLWAFCCEGIEFTVSRSEFDVRAFAWAKESAATINRMRPEIMPVVMKLLEGWPCDESKAHVSGIDLSEYGENKTMDVSFTGDDSWADFGVNVVVRNGAIVDSYAGD